MSRLSDRIKDIRAEHEAKRGDKSSGGGEPPRKDGVYEAYRTGSFKNYFSINFSGGRINFKTYISLNSFWKQGAGFETLRLVGGGMVVVFQGENLQELQTAIDDNRVSEVFEYANQNQMEGKCIIRQVHLQDIDHAPADF